MVFFCTKKSLISGVFGGNSVFLFKYEIKQSITFKEASVNEILVLS